MLQSRLLGFLLLLATCLWPHLAQGYHVTTPLREFGLGKLSSARFAPDGTVLTTAWPDVHVWDVATSALLRQTRLPAVPGVWKAVSRDGRFAVAAGLTSFTVVDATSGGLYDEVVFDPLNTETGGMEFSPDNTCVALTWYPYDIGFQDVPGVRSAVWEIASGREVFRIDSGWEGSYSPDGSLLIYAGEGGTAYLRDGRNGAPMQTLIGHAGWLTFTGFSPDGRYAITGGEDRTARVWDVDTGEPRGVFVGHGGYVGSCALSPDNRLLLTSSADGSVRLWDAETSATLQTYSYPAGTLATVDFAPDGSRFLIANAEAVVLRDTRSGEVVGTIEGFGAPVNTVAFSPDGRHFAAGTDGQLRQWDHGAGGPVSPQARAAAVLSAAYSADGSRLLTGGVDGTPRMWDTRTLDLVASYTPHQREIRAVGFVPGGPRFMTAGADSVVALWDSDTTAPLATYLQPEVVRQLAVAPDGSEFLVGGGVGIRQCQTATGSLVHQFPVYGRLLTLAPDGSTFAAAGLFGGYSLTDLDTGVTTSTLLGAADITALSFAPDGKELFVGRASGGELRQVPGSALVHSYDVEVRSACFSPDGGNILVGGSDGRVTLWPTGRMEEGSEFWMIR